MPSCLLWEMLGQHCVGIPLLVSKRTSGWGPRVKTIYDPTDAAVFSPDSRFVLSRSNSAKLWDVATGTELHCICDTGSDCTAIAFSPDGQSVLCGFRDGTVEVWTIAPWAKQAVLPSRSNAKVKAVTFTPDSQSVVAASEYGTVRVWALTQQTQEVFTAGYGISGFPYDVVFSFDCRFMAAARCLGGEARIWKLIPGESDEHLVIARPWDGMYDAAAFSPDGCSVVFGAEDGIHVWDTATGTQRSTMNGHSDRVTALAFSRDGQFLVSGADDTTILVWNFTAGTEQPDYVLKGHTWGVNSVAFSTDAKLVVSTSPVDGTMRVWSGAISVNESVIEGHTRAVSTISFSHDGGHIASGSEDSTIRVWDAVTGRQKYILEGHERPIERVVFSPDSQTIASCSQDHTVRLWDFATGTQVHAVLHHPWDPYNIEFSHDGQSILAINHYTLEKMRGVLEAYVWEVATGAQKFVISYSPLASQLYDWHQDPIPVIFSPSDRLLVATLYSDTDSSSSDGSDEESTSLSSGRSDKEAIDYKVWDTSTGVKLAVQDLTPALARDMDCALLSRNKQAVAPYHVNMMHHDGWVPVSQDQDNWHRVCWLPAERQMILSSTYAYHGQKVCIGASSGAVTILDFSNVPMPWMR
jgi:WD40 repeat protein